MQKDYCIIVNEEEKCFFFETTLVREYISELNISLLFT